MSRSSKRCKAIVGFSIIGGRLIDVAVSIPELKTIQRFPIDNVVGKSVEAAVAHWLTVGCWPEGVQPRGFSFVGFDPDRFVRLLGLRCSTWEVGTMLPPEFILGQVPTYDLALILGDLVHPLTGRELADAVADRIPPDTLLNAATSAKIPPEPPPEAADAADVAVDADADVSLESEWDGARFDWSPGDDDVMRDLWVATEIGTRLGLLR